MKRWILIQNIRTYEQMLAATDDPHKRETLEALLREARTTLADLESRPRPELPVIRS